MKANNKKIAIVQSNYIPWKGYFDLISGVDEFILFDDVQYTKRDWRNRNKIKTKNGLAWLTIPVQVKDKYYQKISETQTADKNWAKKHWTTIKHNYSQACAYNENKDLFENLYLTMDERYLSKINYRFLTVIMDILGIKTKLTWSHDYKLVEDKTERLVSLCEQVGATEYISGPAAKEYIKEDIFKEANIKFSWMDYSGYREYRQLYPPFEHAVSIIDLIFNTGQNARAYLSRTGS